MRASRRPTGIGFLGRTALIGLFVGALPAGALAETGVTDTTIKIGLFGPLTGGAAIHGQPVNNGPISVYMEQNEKGGVHGRKFVFVQDDSACEATKALAAVKKLIHQNRVFMIHGGTCSTAVAATTEEVVKSGVPHLLMAATMDSLTAPVKKNVYTVQMTGSADGRGMARFAASMPGVKKVAIVGRNNDWAETKIRPMRQYFKEKGIEVVARETLEANASDATAQALKLKSVDPDVIILVNYPTEAATLIRDAWKYGLRSKSKDSPAVIVSTPDLLDLVERVGNKEALRDLYGITVIAGPFGSPEMKKWEGIRYKHFPKDIKKSVAYQGVAGATVVIEALKKAGRDLTREKFLAAMEGTKSLKDHGASCSISFSASSHQGCNDPTVWTLLPDGRVVNLGPVWRDLSKN